MGYICKYVYEYFLINKNNNSNIYICNYKIILRNF